MRYKKVHVYIYVQKETNSIFKVETSSEDGTLKVYDENGNLILYRRGLRRIEIEMIERELCDLIKA
ncbi:MAG: hypothetical protein J7J89_06420 [Thermoplasmata archaeon]|nr:hypothetical protein [Thermoplasmata archaeon]